VASNCSAIKVTVKEVRLPTLIATVMDTKVMSMLEGYTGCLYYQACDFYSIIYCNCKRKMLLYKLIRKHEIDRLNLKV